MSSFNNYGYGGYPTGGYYYQEAPKLSMSQGITPEEMKTLSTKSSGFNLNIPEEEMLRSYCTHRYQDRFATTEDDEGNFTCAICGTKFKGFNGTTSEAREVAKNMVDLMETIKMRALTLPPKTIRDVNQIIPIIKRIPDLYDQALNDYNRAMNSQVNTYGAYGQNSNGFNLYENMVNPMAGNGYYDPAMQQAMYGAQAMGQPMYQQPMMNQQFGQQQMYQQPMMNQQFGQQMYQQPQQQGNPFNVGSNPVNTQPQFGANTQAQQPQSTATNDAKADTVTVSKKLTD